MSAELLIPMMGGLPGNMVKAGQPVKVTKSVPGFESNLKAAKRAIDKPHRNPDSLRKPQVENQLNRRKTPVKDSHGEEGVHCLPDAMLVEAEPIVETGGLLIETGESNPLTDSMVISAPSATRSLASSGESPGGLPIDPAFAEIRASTAVEEPANDTKLTFVPGGSALGTQSETTGDKAQTSANMEHGDDNQEMSKNQVILKPDSALGTKTGEGGGNFWPGSDRPPAASAADTSQSNILWDSETLHPASLITAESERLRGVKMPVPAESEGMIQSPHNSVQTETLLVEKVDLSQKPLFNEDIMGQIVKKIELFPNQKPNVVTIKLEPEFLGRLQINLEVVDDVLIAKFSTENHQVKQLLETGMGQLRTQLEATGIRLERAEVDIDLGHHQGEFQHHNQSNYQGNQPRYHDVSHYYPVHYISEASTPEMVESQAPPDDYYDGSVNYLI